MLIAFLLLAAVADWVPAHWSTGEPQSISLLRGTPINCVLLKRASWSEAFCEPTRLKKRRS